MATPRVETTSIPGLLSIDLPLHEDPRGWFKENWHRTRMTELGLPDFGPVQHNLAYNHRRGVTRGIHAEPWDKLVSVATGSVFGAWVDLRDGPTFGQVHHQLVGPGQAVFVPRGVGNSYQALEPTCYSYLVNDHWNPGAVYVGVHPDDPTLAIPWPIEPHERELSDKDRQQPGLSQVQPFPARRPLVIGASGQVGRALRAQLPDARFVGLSELDMTDGSALEAWQWREHDLVVNASGYTNVDGAESPEGRSIAWRVNAEGPTSLARLATRHGFVLVHYSSDYVFDGTQDSYDEHDPVNPLGVYGQSKAAGDLAVSTTPRHYVIRTSWVVGEGHNFVRTMRALALRGVSPRVVEDQVGRLTFADELARATVHLWEVGAPYGTYNCTNAGEPRSWADIAVSVYERSGRSAEDVTPVTTREYASDRVVAPRPARSVLDLSRLRATGFEPEGVDTALQRYVDALG